MRYSSGDRRIRPSSLLGAALVVVLLMAATACGDDDKAAVPVANEDTAPVTLRLGLFPNVTHAPAIIGTEKGLFAQALGTNVTLETAQFNAGPEAVEALFGETLDATFIGPNPAINAFAKSKGEAVRIVAGSTSGGASLIVKPSIATPADLKGTKIASPQLGNTQDVALRAWLKENGLSSEATGAGDVSIQPQANAETLTAFKAGQIEGAWVPEPWATRLRLEGGGKVLVDEETLWPEGRFVTTHLIVRTEFLAAHPATVKKLIAGLLDAIDFAESSPAEAQKVVNDGIEHLTTKRFSDATIAGAWENLTFTPDPVASSLAKSKDDAVDAGLLDEVDLNGIYDLKALNEVLSERNKPAVAGL